MQLLIVDDEMQIRTGLEVGIEWNELGFEKIFTAKNGVEAMEICEQYQPEIIITDIQMPGINGLELSRSVLDRYNNVEIIILSGYSEFDYAREAMRLRTFDYLLKPINIEELIESVKKAQASLKAKVTSSKNDELSLEIRRRKVIKKLIYSQHELDNNQIKTFYEVTGLRRCKELCVGMISIDGESHLIKTISPNQTRIYILKYISEILIKHNAFLLYHDKNTFFFIREVFSDYENTQKLDQLRIEINYFNKGILNQFNSSVSVGISRVSSVESLPVLFRETKKVLAHRFYMGRASWIDKSDVVDEEKILVSPIDSDVLIKYIIEFDYNGAQVLIAKAFKELIDQKVISRDFVRLFCIELRNNLIETIYNKGIDIEKIFENNRVFLDEIPEYCTIVDYEKWIENLYYLIFEGLTTLTGKNHSRVVIQVIDYLNHNYMKDIKLTSVAEYVNKSSTYMSYLFKKEMGVTYVEYLNGLRIENAQKILRSSDDMAYEVARKVGFSNYKYFARVFKKITGLTPVEYRTIN